MATTTEDQAGLQWGGRFEDAPDAALIAFGSSLEDDLVLAPFDVRCSRAHVTALTGGGLLSGVAAGELHAALEVVAEEIADGTFAAFARAGTFEDVHGAIDARVRELAPDAGASLHAGRSRNDQVATTLLLYARDRAARGARLALGIARAFETRALTALDEGTLLAATTHWQPAQPVSLAFWLDGAAQGFVRAAARFARVARDAACFCPLGSAALAGSSLPLDRAAAARELGFAEPSRNALDSVGDRDVALDLLHAAARAAVTASRPSEEFVLWTTPAFGYARLGDAAATGSSLMPQKKNPDPFELVRAAAARTIGTYSGALASTSGIGLSYHRDLQETKAQIVRGTEHALLALDAFSRAFAHLHFNADAMDARAGEGYTVATDLADALIASGATAREAHAAVGERVLHAERQGRPLDARDVEAIGLIEAPLDGAASIAAKRTSGSPHPEMVARSIEATQRELDAIAKDLA
jgi:argininosuccinate lyase